MSYFTIKHIKGHPYLYEVHSEREGDTVRQVFDAYWGRADAPGAMERRPRVSRRERRAKAKAERVPFIPITTEPHVSLQEFLEKQPIIPEVAEVKPTVKAIEPEVIVREGRAEKLAIPKVVAETKTKPEIITLYRGEPKGIRAVGGFVPFTPDIEVAKGWAGTKGQVVQVSMTREEFEKVPFHKLPDQIATYEVPQEIYEKVKPIAPEAVALPPKIELTPEEILERESRPPIDEFATRFRGELSKEWGITPTEELRREPQIVEPKEEAITTEQHVELEVKPEPTPPVEPIRPSLEQETEGLSKPSIIGEGFPEGAKAPDWQKDVNFRRQDITVYKVVDEWDGQVYKAIVQSPTNKNISKFTGIGEDYKPETDYILVDNSIVKYNKPKEEQRTKREQFEIVDKRYSLPKNFEPLKDKRQEGYLFRGISNEEWQGILKKRYIESTGTYNIEESQKGLTLFDKSPASALSYASGFAPWQYVPTFDNPGIVIKIKTPKTGTVIKPSIPSEVGVQGRIPLSEIEAVYEIRVAAQQPGTVEYKHNAQKNTLSDIAHSAPNNFELYREVPKEEWESFIMEQTLPKLPPSSSASAETKVKLELKPEPNINALLAHLREAPQSKSTENYLRKTFGDEALAQAHQEGLLTRTPKGVYTTTVKGREQIRDIPQSKVNLYAEGKRILAESITMKLEPTTTPITTKVKFSRQLAGSKGGFAIMDYKTTTPIDDPDAKQQIIEAYNKVKNPVGYATYNAIHKETNLPYETILGVLKQEHINDPHTIHFNVDRMGKNIFFKYDKIPPQQG